MALKALRNKAKLGFGDEAKQAWNSLCKFNFRFA
jgi:hypothetical protein